MSITPPTVADLGLDESYFDCSGCPQGYAINRRGTAIAWLEKDSATGRSVARMVALDGTPLGDGSYSANGVITVIPVVSLGDASVGGGDTTPIAIVNDDFVGDREFNNLGAHAPIYVDFVSGEIDLGPEGTRASYE